MFRFITNQGGKYKGEPGVTLSVTDLQVLVERSSTQTELKCHSSFKVADRPSYVWYRNQQKMKEETFSLRVSVNDDNSYSCALKGCEDHPSPPVYAPKLLSVSVSPSGEIVEGSSVTLTCSSDANPAANYTWYKENDRKLPSQQPQLFFRSIQPSESGEYYCTAENELGRRTSDHKFIDVEYAPKLLSVSVSPSGEIVEGSSVNLTCSSDANPAANYTWYKENEDSPKASGQIFTITDLRPEHSGNYYCEAQNTRGRRNSTLNLTVVAGAWKLRTVAIFSAIVLAVILVCVFLWIIKKRVFKQESEPEERPDARQQVEPAEQQANLHYASVHFSKDDPVYSNITPAQPKGQKEEKKEEEEMVEYTTVSFNSAGTAQRARGQKAPEDPAALYSTVSKRHKKQ
ncbi:B-cell receptor CD22-like [Seriola dumerili]|uniref:B-cell receptor CD22-like n=1 Tax=Seriola dumerili TaxID=41447 RepID=UPI000BBE25B1|nr:B-cell receptor CD22-like [Seriola dumerili]